MGHSSEIKSVQTGELPDVVVIVSTEKVLSLLENAVRDKKGWGNYRERSFI